jgi:hypothetical protein
MVSDSRFVIIPLLPEARGRTAHDRTPVPKAGNLKLQPGQALQTPLTFFQVFVAWHIAQAKLIE